MTTEGTLERILSQVTPDHVRALVLARVRESPADAASGVSLLTLIDLLCQGADLGSGREGWSAQLALKAAIRAAVVLLPDLRYVEGDA